MSKPTPIPNSPKAQTGNTAKINNADLQHLVDSRAAELKTRNAADEKIERLNAQILEMMDVHGAKRHQLLTGAIVTIVAPRPRQSVSPEKLLALGVNPDVIKAATVETPVRRFPRVDGVGQPTQPAKDDPSATDAAVVN